MSVPAPIDVVFAIDDNYAAATTIVGHSIRANLREQATPLRLHVIDGGLGTEGRAEVRAGLGSVGEVVIHSVEGHFQLPQAKIKHWTSAALGRLHVGTVLPDDLHRVIYLDADAVVLGDLSELIEEDLGGQAIGVVLNEVGGDRSWQLKDTAVYSDHGAPALVSVTMARPTTTPPPAAMPSPSRAATRIAPFGASAQTVDSTVKISAPASATLRRPSASLIEPISSWPRANPMMKEVRVS